MPVHDWTRVDDGIFHDFHHEWISTIKRALNAGRLPSGFYALAEQIAGGLGPDVLTLEAPQSPKGNGHTEAESETDGGVAIAAAPPRVRFTLQSEQTSHRRKQSRIAIRHTSDHRVVAVIEIVSPGNKSSKQALRAFVEKAAELINAGVHLLVIDLFPPGPRDPNGIHGEIWEQIESDDYRQPADAPLTLAAYSSGAMKCAYIEPTAVGAELPDMPLFLGADWYIPTPLEATYQSAFEGVPAIWREQLK